MPSPVSTSQLAKLQNFYVELKDDYDKKLAQAQEKLRNLQIPDVDLKSASQQTLAALSLAGSVALNKPVDVRVLEQVKAVEAASPAASANPETEDLVEHITAEEHQSILDKMSGYVQMPAGHLPKEEELYLEQQLNDMLGFSVVAELDGNRLNHSIGIMGGEQHLKRFPGDTLEQHDAYQEAGIAPNRGAFGWFTEQGQLSDRAKMREKYYFAVQTMYLPNWNTDHPTLKEWYKFRKMIVINPVDQVAVVGVVGDAGPAQWVKKQYGGSPEIIREGKIWSKQARGHVLLFFVDDPDDTIPLGPISLSFESLEKKAQASPQL